jgi:hypothetical protein
MANSKKETAVFVNPFEAGVNYKDFLAAIPKDVTVEDYCKEHLTAEQITWLVQDIKHFKK